MHISVNWLQVFTNILAVPPYRINTFISNKCCHQTFIKWDSISEE